MNEDHPAIVSELAASLRKMLLLYEGRVLHRTCDRWEQEARNVLAKLDPTTKPTAGAVIGKDKNGKEGG